MRVIESYYQLLMLKIYLNMSLKYDYIFINEGRDG